MNSLDKVAAPADSLGASVSNVWTVLWKSLPLGSVLAGVLFWKYLSSIGRPDLFLPCVSNPSGMASFLLVFTLMTVLGIYLLALPSCFLAFMFQSIEKDIGKQAAASLPWGIMALGVGTALIPILMWKGSAEWSVLLGPLLGVALFFLWLRHEGALAQMFPGEKRWFQIWQGTWYGGVLLVGGAMTTFSMSLVLPFLGSNHDVWWSNLADMGILVLIATTSLLPAIMYCYSKKSNHSWQQSVVAFSFGTAVLLMLFVMVAPPVTQRIMNKAATEIGLRIDVPYRYVLHTDRLDVSLLDSGKWNVVKNSSSFSVTGMIPLSMGGLVLLCPANVGRNHAALLSEAEECLVLKDDEVMRIPESREKVSDLL